MPTSLDIITRAFRKLNVVAIGATPQDAEIGNALSVLRAFYADAFDQGAYGPLADVLVTGATYQAQVQQSVVASGAITVTAPLTTASPIRSAYQVSQPTGVQQFVHGSAGWVDLAAVGATTPLLVSDGMAEELAAYLALVLAPDYGQQVSASDAELAKGLASDVAAGLAGPAYTGGVLSSPTVGAIIQGALSKLQGNRGATPFQTQTAVEALRGMLQTWSAQGLFGALTDGPVIVGGEHDIRPGQRVMAEANPHLHLQDRFSDWNGPGGWYDYGWAFGPVGGWGERPPRDLSITVVANADGGDSSTYVFDAQAGLWQNISKVGAYYDTTDRVWRVNLNLPCPLAQKYGEALKASLAVHMADDFGLEPKPSTIRTAAAGLMAMAYRPDSRRDVLAGEFY